MYCRYARSASFLAAFSTVALFIPAHAAAPSAILLKYKYSPGEVLKFQVAENIDSQVTVGTRTTPVTSHTVSELTQTVKSVDPTTGNATLQVQFGRPTMTLDGKVVNLPLAPATAANGVTMVVTPAGNPKSVTGGIGASSVFMGSGSTPPGILSGSFGQLSVFPSHTVRIGDAWRSSSAVAQAGLQLFAKQTLVSVDTKGVDSVATIDSRYSIDMTPKAPGGGMAVSGTGRELFDVGTGTLESSSMTMVMVIKSQAPYRAGEMNSHATLTMQMQRIGASG